MSKLWIAIGEEFEMRVSNGMRPVRPGEILAGKLEELGLSANALAKALCVPANRITAASGASPLTRLCAWPVTSALRRRCG